MKEIGQDTDELLCGVYQIKCISNNTFYIGSSCNIVKRIKEHFKNLEDNNHYGRFQNTFNKYGKHTFKCFLIEECEKKDLLIREDYFIKIKNPQLNSSNSAFRPPNFNELTEEQKEKRYKSWFKTRSKSNFYRNPECYKKTIETRKKRGYKHKPQSYEKMIQTKIKNNTLYVAHPKLKGRKNPEHSNFMKNRYKKLSNEQKLSILKNLKRKNITNKPKITMVDENTGLIENMHQYEWCKKYNISASSMCMLANGKKQKFKDKNNHIWKPIK